MFGGEHSETVYFDSFTNYTHSHLFNNYATHDVTVVVSNNINRVEVVTSVRVGEELVFVDVTTEIPRVAEMENVTLNIQWYKIICCFSCKILYMLVYS